MSTTNDTETELGAYLAICSRYDPGSSFHIPLSYRDEVDAAFHHWIERGIDRVLAVTMCDGDDLLIAASAISEMCVSTPEGRARARGRQAARKAEGGFEE